MALLGVFRVVLWTTLSLDGEMGWWAALEHFGLEQCVAYVKGGRVGMNRT